MFSKLAATIAVASVASASVSQATTSAFVKYFNYEGSLVVGGSVNQVSGDDVYVTLSGLDPACTAGAGDAANSCGIHIHAGTDCTSDAGGHYYNTDVVSADPWSNISYTRYSSTDDSYMGHDTVVTGYSATELTGHAYIVHDYTGARVACALLEEIGAGLEQSTEAGFVPYFNYNGLLDTGGSVYVTTTGVTQKVTGTLTGIDERCKAGPSEAANSCGLHIHTGMSCGSDAGGHFYNHAMLSADPWSNVVGTPDLPAYDGAPATTSISVAVPTGAKDFIITGHTFIVHDYTGARVACSILELDPCEGVCGENTKCEQGVCVADCGVANNCCVGDGNCDDAYMRTCVGSFDPVCEESLWDTQCADEAKMTCGLTC